MPITALGLAAIFLVGLKLGVRRESRTYQRPKDLSAEGIPIRYRFLQGADLAGASAKKNEIFRGNIVDSDFSRGRVESGLVSGAFFNNVKAYGLSLKGSRLDNLILIDSDFREADFRATRAREFSAWGVDFRHADFRDADLALADFRLCRLEGAKFNAKTRLPFSSDEALRRGMVAE